jgi:divalent metal cation (Fe/Co/Zn/Cd) transporter
LHPYGHGKVEFLAAGFEGSMLLGVGVYSIFKVIQSYYIPHNLMRTRQQCLLAHQSVSIYFKHFSCLKSLAFY